MRNLQLHDLVDAVARVDGAQSLSAAAEVFAAGLDQFGLKKFLITGLPVANDGWGQNIFFDGWSPDWFDHYTQQKLFLHDPCVARSRYAAKPFLWHELDRPEMSNKARQVMGDAEEFGLKDGICVPIRFPLAGPAVVTAGSERIEVPAGMLPFIETLCVHAFRSISKFETKVVRDQSPPLTPREREVLQWSAAGKTAEDISVILNVTKHTVDSHHRNIRSKLNATNLLHAVTIALRRGEIEI